MRWSSGMAGVRAWRAWHACGRAAVLVSAALVSAALVSATGCQSILGLEEGKPLPGGTGGSGTTTTTTMSSGGGEGGAGGLGGMGGGGGPPLPTCDDGAQNGDETGIDCGGPTCNACPLLLLVAGGGSTVIGGTYHPDEGWATVTLDGGSTASQPAIAWSSAGDAVALIQGAGNALQFATYRQPSTFSAFTAVGAGIVTRSAPAASAAPAGALAVYQGLDFKHYFAIFAGGAFSTAADPVGGSGAGQSFGPNEADVAPDGADAVVAFTNGVQGANVNDTYVQRRTGAVWQNAALVATDSDFDRPSPRLTALAGGQGLLLVYVQDPTGQIRFSRWNGAAWSAPASIIGAASAARPALAAIPGGGAMLAYRGTDGKLYATHYDGAAWGAVTAVPDPAADILSAPALAPGVGAASAELAYVTTGGEIHHVRYAAGAWGAPVSVVTIPDITQVALASAPP